MQKLEEELVRLRDRLSQLEVRMDMGLLKAQEKGDNHLRDAVYWQKEAVKAREQVDQLSEHRNRLEKANQTLRDQQKAAALAVFEGLRGWVAMSMGRWGAADFFGHLLQFLERFEREQLAAFEDERAATSGQARHSDC